MKFPLDYSALRLRNRSLFLAAPLYGNLLHFGYHRSVCDLLGLCIRERIRLGMKYVGCDSLVPRARNRLAAFFLRSDCTDLLFVDSDISFLPEHALSLLACDEPIVGGVYPRKQHDWNRIHAAARSGIPPSQLTAYGMVPVVNWAAPGDYPLDSLIEVRQLGTGFLRIRREVFGKMIIQLGLDIAFDYSNDEEVFKGETGYDFFPTGPDIRYPLGSGSRQYLSEDYAFSEMARVCGYKLYAAPWISLTHSGYCDFTGDLNILDEGLNAALSDSSEMPLAEMP